MNGQHIVCNAHGCAFDLTQTEVLFAHCKRYCEQVGLTVVGTSAHTFDNGAITLCILLAESHLCLHSWPETMSVALDVYVCNHSEDNSQKAHQLVTLLMSLLKPEEFGQKAIDRLSVAPHAYYAKLQDPVSCT